LNRQTRETRFFLYLAFGAPHYPMMAPRKYVERFPEGMDRDRKMHAAMVAAIDDVVGEIVSVLQAKGFDQDTVIFYQADNGSTQEVRADHLARPYKGGSNGRYRGYKGSLWEGGTRVPALVRWPARIKPGQVNAEVGMAMDILPTFVKWAGGTVPGGVDGMDISPVVLEGKRSARPEVFWEYDGQRAIRRGEWKYMENYRDGLGSAMVKEAWLSNLKEDAVEKENFLGRAPEVTRDLKERLANWKV